MPSASATQEAGPVLEVKERLDDGRKPASEHARYQPRFRVVTRKPLAGRQRPSGSPFHRTLLLALVPTSCLVTYVFFWTLTMRGAYYRDQLQDEVRHLRIEQADLEAEKRRLQSPRMILERAASELDMQPALTREFAQIPVPTKLARGTVSP